jgi:hypothetical protein
MPDLKALWQSILDCDCNTRGTWCSNCCDAFGAIGDTLDRKCPVCGGPCEVRIECPKHE